MSAELVLVLVAQCREDSPADPPDSGGVRPLTLPTGLGYPCQEMDRRCSDVMLLRSRGPEQRLQNRWIGTGIV